MMSQQMPYHYGLDQRGDALQRGPSPNPRQQNARADLLAGLRTRRGDSPQTFNYQDAAQQQRDAYAAAQQQLKPSAPVFMPGAYQQQQHQQQQQQHHYGNDLDALQAQLAAMQMSAAHSTPNVAASYGAAQGQPRNDMAQHMRFAGNDDALAQLYQQRQAEQIQEQQLEAIRRQEAAQQHSNNLLAHLQNFGQQRQREQSAQRQQQQQLEQRQAAQASIQANLRNRQVQNVYAQLLEEDQLGRLDRRQLGGRDLWQFSMDVVEEEYERQAAATQLANTQEQLRMLQMQQYQLQLQQLQQQARQAAEAQQQQQQQQRRSPSGGAPTTTPGAGAARERTVSHADKASSWRSRPSAGAAASEDKDLSPEGSPSVRSSKSFNSSADETPQTSEEGVYSILPAAAAAAADLPSKPVTSSTTLPKHPGQYGSLGRSSGRNASPSPANSASSLPLFVPTPRSFSGGASAAASGTATPVTVRQASRQPRGPPTEFQALNFTTRLNARTRKEALSKLRQVAGSPRAAVQSVA